MNVANLMTALRVREEPYIFREERCAFPIVWHCAPTATIGSVVRGPPSPLDRVPG